ncbi:MAG: BatD family protein, partial [Gemmatimonadetes bacterium]|nr:BatD family protein [Gemmatimonadota bacterium]
MTWSADVLTPVVAVLVPVVVGVLLAYDRRRRHARLAALGERSLIARLVPPGALRSRRARAARLLAASLLAAVAWWGPRWGNERRARESEGADVILAVDVSRSMLANDEKPTRLDRARQEIRKLRSSARAHRMGLVVFAGRSYVMAPLTTDAGALELYLDNLSPDLVGQPGSSIGPAIRQGTDLLTASRSAADRALVILTDGESFEPPEAIVEAAHYARDGEVKVIALGFGTETGSSIPEVTENGRDYHRDREGVVVITKAHPEVLETIARESGGVAIPASVNDRSATLHGALDDLKTASHTEQGSRELQARFQWFLLPALLLLFWDAAMAGWRPRRAVTAVAVLALIAPIARAQDPAVAAYKSARSAHAHRHGRTPHAHAVQSRARAPATRARPAGRPAELRARRRRVSPGAARRRGQRGRQVQLRTGKAEEAGRWRRLAAAAAQAEGGRGGAAAAAAQARGGTRQAAGRAAARERGARRTRCAEAARPEAEGRAAARGEGLVIGALLLFAQVTAADPVVVQRSRPDPEAIAFRAVVVPESVTVGQQAIYQVAVFVPDAIRQRLRRNPEFVPPELRAMLAYDLPRTGYQLLKNRTIGATTYEIHVFQRALFPITAGRHVIAPAELSYSLPLGSSFFSREELHTVRSDPVTLIATDPPPGGRPSSWNGAVGRFAITTRVDQTAARVRDLVTVTARIEGAGNINLLPRPALEVAWGSVTNSSERVTIDTTATEVAGWKEFDWLVTPRDSGTLIVPPVRFAMYDPVSHQYGTVESAPETLSVSGSAPVGAAGSIVGRTLPPVRTAWRGERGPLLVTRPLFLLALLLVPLPAVAGLGLRALRTRRSRRRPAHGAERLATASGAPADLRRAFRTALEERLGLDALAFARTTDAARVLRRHGVTAVTATAVAEALAA